jgi:hypothetical protein
VSLAATTGPSSGPTPPATGRSVIWADSTGVFYSKRADGSVFALTPVDSDLTASAAVLVKARAATTLASNGLTTATTTGTASSADDVNGRWLSLTQSSVLSAGAVCSVASSAAVNQIDWSSDLVMRVGTGATLTSNRMWFGWASATPTGSATPTAHLAAFRYDTAADGTAYWRTVTAAGSATQTVTTTTVPVTASTNYVLRVTVAAGAVIFWINSVVVATHTTNLPTSGTGLFYYMSSTALTTSARPIRMSRLAHIDYEG